METTIKVGEQSRDLIDILEQFNIGYDMFQTYMEKYYTDAERLEMKVDEDFYHSWCKMINVVEDHLSKIMIYELTESHFTSI